MNANEFEEMLARILPAGMTAELNARSAKRGCKPAELIDEVILAATRKRPAYWQEIEQIAWPIADAIALGISEAWPESFDDCVAVGCFLVMMPEGGPEAYLLEKDGEKLGIVEFICRQNGLGCEEFTREAIDAFLTERNAKEPDTEDYEEQDKADWWKED
jgi:hypothetical protein